MTEKSPKVPPQMSAAIAAVWERFKGSALDRVALLEQTATALLTSQLDESLRHEAVRVAHKLAGSLGTFGFPQGSTLAREIEQALEARNTVEREQAAHLAELVAALRRLLS